MNCAEHHEDVVLTEQDLLQLQLQIAQRADKLAQSRRLDRNPEADWECWLEAEREIIGARCTDAAMAMAP
jgi:hypothetical protein